MARSSERWQLLAFAVAHLVVFLVIFRFVYQIQYTPVAIYDNDASAVLGGKLPYRDFSFEYPPLSLLVFLLPGYFSSSWQGFASIYQVEILVFDLVGLFLIYLIARRLGKAPWVMLGVYTLGVLAVGPIIQNQYDIFPAVVTLAAVYFFWLGRHKTAWFLVGLGALLKLYPLLLVPIWLIVYWRNHEYRRIWSGLATLLLTCLIILLPFLILSPSSLLRLLDYHTQRGIQIESLYGAFLMLFHNLGWVASRLVFNFGSWNLMGPVPETLDKLSTYFLVVAWVASFALVYWQVRAGKSQFSRMGSYFLIILLLTLLTSKILSPQYLIWLIPFLPLVGGPLRVYVWALFVIIGGLTYYNFPAHYLKLMAFGNPEIIVLLARDLLLAAMAVLAIVNLRRMKASD